jgi:hypothetical protein
MEPSRALRSGHEEAGRCFMAWLTVVGLAAEIDDLRFQEEGRIVPAPGLELLRDRGEEASREAADAVGAIGRLCGCTVAEQVDLAVRADLDRRIGNASRSARLATSQAQRALRQLAQLAFGVSAFTIGGDRIERLDMAAVAVLHPPLGAGSAVSMVEDGVDLWSRTLPELEIEVAGMLCRVLVDRRTGLLLRSQGQEVSFTVDGGDTLRGGQLWPGWSGGTWRPWGGRSAPMTSGRWNSRHRSRRACRPGRRSVHSGMAGCAVWRTSAFRWRLPLGRVLTVSPVTVGLASDISFSTRITLGIKEETGGLEKVAEWQSDVFVFCILHPVGGRLVC